MTDLPTMIDKQLEVLQAELNELATSADWAQRANLEGSRKLRSVANRIVLSSKRLEALVKENTFAR